MATVIIPALLRKLTSGQDRVTVTGTTLTEIVNNLEQQFPGIRNHLLEGDELKSTLAVAIDGEMTSGNLHDPVQPQSEVHFVPAISGGATPRRDTHPLSE